MFGVILCKKWIFERSGSGVESSAPSKAVKHRRTPAHYRAESQIAISFHRKLLHLVAALMKRGHRSWGDPVDWAPEIRRRHKAAPAPKNNNDDDDNKKVRWRKKGRWSTLPSYILKKLAPRRCHGDSFPGVATLQVMVPWRGRWGRRRNRIIIWAQFFFWIIHFN